MRAAIAACRLRRSLAGLAAAVALGVAGAATGGGMEHTMGGKSAREVFAAPGLAALAEAACRGDFEAIAKAVAAGVPVDGEGEERTTPLMWALSCENLAGMAQLLESGANPNRSNGSFTPVYAAATRYNPALLQLLLQHGGDANARKETGNSTALSAALTVGLHGHGWDNWHALLDHGADINRADRSGWTIAMNAAALNQFDRVQELLERGYQHDLQKLADLVAAQEVDFPDAQADQRKVLATLAARGVTPRAAR